MQLNLNWSSSSELSAICIVGHLNSVPRARPLIVNFQTFHLDSQAFGGQRAGPYDDVSSLGVETHQLQADRAAVYEKANGMKFSIGPEKTVLLGPSISVASLRNHRRRWGSGSGAADRRLRKLVWMKDAKAAMKGLRDEGTRLERV